MSFRYPQETGRRLLLEYRPGLCRTSHRNQHQLFGDKGPDTPLYGGIANVAAVKVKKGEEVTLYASRGERDDEFDQGGIADGTWFADNA